MRHYVSGDTVSYPSGERFHSIAVDGRSAWGKMHAILVRVGRQASIVRFSFEMRDEGDGVALLNRARGPNHLFPSAGTLGVYSIVQA